MVIILHLNEMKYVVITRFSRSLLWVKTIVDHRTCILGKPLKNHQCQWSIWEKTFNGDGSIVAKPLKNHRRQWCSVKKTLPSHRLRKMTIVEVKTEQMVSQFSKWSQWVLKCSQRDPKWFQRVCKWSQQVPKSPQMYATHTFIKRIV